MRQAHDLARRVWPASYSCAWSRHDFTLPQLFACLVVREMLKLSYRKAEALLRDSPQWLAGIGMTRAPDHNTLWRAFDVLVETRRVNRMLDLFAELFAAARLLPALSAVKPLTLDSTCFERRRRSRHYDRVCRKMKLPDGAKYAGKTRAIRTEEEVNRARSLAARQMPKLALAVASGCHLVLAARVHTGAGSDAPDFEVELIRAVLLDLDRVRQPLGRVDVADVASAIAEQTCCSRHVTKRESGNPELPCILRVRRVAFQVRQTSRETSCARSRTGRAGSRAAASDSKTHV